MTRTVTFLLNFKVGGISQSNAQSEVTAIKKSILKDDFVVFLKNVCCTQNSFTFPVPSEISSLFVTLVAKKYSIWPKTFVLWLLLFTIDNITWRDKSKEITL